MYFVKNKQEPFLQAALTKKASEDYVSFLKSIKLGDSFLIPLKKTGIKSTQMFSTLLTKEQIESEVNRMKNLVSRRKLGITLNYTEVPGGMLVTRKR